MTRGVRALVLAGLLAAPARSTAQEFVPPDRGRTVSSSSATGFRLGVLGFSTRGGGQVNDDEQGIVGSTVDVAQLGSPLVRLRPSFELGFGTSRNSLHLALEAIFRFQPDDAPAVPYVGGGLGYYDTGSSTDVWPNLVMGFELPFRRSFNWLLEYHALDRMGRHRFLIGLATRGGG